MSVGKELEVMGWSGSTSKVGGCAFGKSENDGNECMWSEMGERGRCKTKA
jgi:hypothetical protein